MVALGVWQIGRARERDAEKQLLIARVHLPTLAFPYAKPADDNLLFRRASAKCDRVLGWQQTASKDAKGNIGWGHLALCQAPSRAAPFLVEVGVSVQPGISPSWAGGIVVGRMKWSPDKRSFLDRVLWRKPDRQLMIVAERPVGDLTASEQPNPDRVNTSWGYAVQWFLFAATALVIYALALRKRWRERAALK